MSDSVQTWGVGTYAFTQLVNHLNQEKASLLEKVEHYEREVQKEPIDTTNNSNNRRIISKNIRHNFDDYDSKFEDDITVDNLGNQYEFYYEKNVRP
jgi:hypothetical protein